MVACGVDGVDGDKRPQQSEPFDVIIIGGGPAGLAAAIYLGRYLRRTLVINDREPRTRWHRPTGHNVLGYPAGIMRSQLLEWGAAHARQYDAVQFHAARVEQVSLDGDLFAACDDQGVRFTSRGLILAMGVEHQLPDLPDVFDFAGYSIFHCPECDGYSVRGKRVAVMGSTRGTAGMALSLRTWTDNITVLTGGAAADFDPQCRQKLADQKIAVLEHPLERLLGDRKRGTLEGIQLAGGKTLPCDAMFVNLGEAPPTDLLAQLPLRLHKGQYVHVDYRQRTDVPRCYAAGDIVAFAQTQLSVAMGQGAMAAIWLHKELLPDCYRLGNDREEPGQTAGNPDAPRPQPVLHEACPLSENRS